MSIFDEVAARYPGVFDDHPRVEPAPHCDHRAQFAHLHQHINDAAALQHRHIHHVEETIMAALDDLKTEVNAYAQTVDGTVIPAFDAIMAAIQNGAGAASEADLAAVTTQIQDATARLTDKAREAHALVGGAG
jgi:AcrR family transcriptional regulator